MKFQLGNISLTGRLARDPELRYTPQGTAITKFSIPFSYGEKNSQGEWENKTNWWNITVFDKQAEEINTKLVKGDMVAVSGTPVCRTYTNKDGVEKFSLEVQYAQVFNLSPNKRTDAPADGVTDIDTGLAVSIPETELPF